MTYRGHIRNGVAVLDSPVALPDGTPVTVAVERADADFWRTQSIDELARQQGIRPIHSADDLGGDWPDEDSIDEFIALLREVRR